MRDQLNELLKLAKQLRSTIQVNHIDDQTIYVSTWITVRRSGTDYYAISFLANRKLEVALYENKDYISNSITIDVEKVSGVELNEIILRSKEDIINFIAKLDDTREKRRLDKIIELQNQLSELEGNVSTN
jgi:pyruvate kinase